MLIEAYGVRAVVKGQCRWRPGAEFFDNYFVSCLFTLPSLTLSLVNSSTSEHVPEYVRMLLEAGANPNWGIVDGGLNALHHGSCY
jgi:hypothetical protein